MKTTEQIKTIIAIGAKASWFEFNKSTLGIGSQSFNLWKDNYLYIYFNGSMNFRNSKEFRIIKIQEAKLLINKYKKMENFQ